IILRCILYYYREKTVLADNFCQNKALLNRIGIIFNLLTSGIGIFAPEMASIRTLSPAPRFRYCKI
ncbi:MAG: hypothetical protein ACKOCH_16265, partial [Bacteroidota bacterium]